MLIKYIKSVFWRVAKRLSYIEDAECLEVETDTNCTFINTDEISHTRVALPGYFGQPQPSSGEVHVTWKITVGLLHNLICTKHADIQNNTNY